MVAAIRPGRQAPVTRMEKSPEKDNDPETLQMQARNRLPKTQIRQKTTVNKSASHGLINCQLRFRNPMIIEATKPNTDNSEILLNQYRTLSGRGTLNQEKFPTKLDIRSALKL